MSKGNEIDDDELNLTRDEEKALARKAKKNASKWGALRGKVTVSSSRMPRL